MKQVILLVSKSFSFLPSDGNPEGLPLNEEERRDRTLKEYEGSFILDVS